MRDTDILLAAARLLQRHASGWLDRAEKTNDPEALKLWHEYRKAASLCRDLADDLDDRPEV